MAKETIVRLIDDTDGGPAHETVKVGIDGQLVEVDLSTKNAKTLRNLMQPYINSGVKVKPQSVSGKPGRPKGNADNTRIREWATAQGYEVAPRGRIRQEVVDAYAKTH